MNIVIVAENYPYRDDPAFAFVQQLAFALSNEGEKVTVIAPQSVSKALIRRTSIKPRKSIDVSPEEHKIEVLRPYTLTFSNTRLSILTRISKALTTLAIRRGIRKCESIDALYCYFWHTGLMTGRVSKSIPLFVQASECDITVMPYMRKEKYLQKVLGVVCASSKNKEESIAAGLTVADKCQVIVNGYRKDLFYKIDKSVARDQLGIKQDTFIVCFVGGFIERKGITELSEALKQLGGVESIFIGKGNVIPTCNNIVFQGVVNHNELVNYLNCADIFVLPTKAEGCCNAIIEALACGLPVVSSNKSFNDEILDETCSIRINEDSVDEIREAIKYLRDNAVIRSEMSKAALVKAETLTIEHRGKGVSDFIKNRMGTIQ